LEVQLLQLNVKTKITDSKSKLGRGIEVGTKMLETQLLRKDAEKKVEALENRIKRLVDEEDKTRKKIKETQDRCVHIQTNRKRHEVDNSKQFEYQEYLDEIEDQNRVKIRERKETHHKNK